MSGSARYIIIGDGAAGTTAAQHLRLADPSASITILSDDPHAAYFRAALTNYLLGELREDQIFAVPPAFYYEYQVNRVLARVASVDTARSQLWLAQGGRPLEYDGLVVAAGARANPPTFEGAWLPGVMTMRTLTDVRRVMDLIRLQGLRRAVVVGGGPLALEWAHGLNIRGVKVTMVVREKKFMPQSLDAVGSDLLAARLRQSGVEVRLGEEIHAAVGGQNARLAGCVTKSGAQIPCELLAVAIGVICNSEFLRGSPIQLTPRGAVIVDRKLRTNVPNVFAAGDIAAVDGEVLQLWEPARVQGRVAAVNLSRAGDESYSPGVHYMATRLYDLDFASIGQAATPVQGAEELIDFPQHTGKISYKKAVVKDGRLVGALLFGEREERVRKRGRVFKRLIDEQTDVSFLKQDLLDPTLDLTGILKPRALVAARPPTAAAPAPAAGKSPEANGAAKVSPAKVRGTQAISLTDLPNVLSLRQGAAAAAAAPADTSAPSPGAPAAAGAAGAATGAMTSVAKPDVSKMKGTQAISVMPDMTRTGPPAIAKQNEEAAKKARTAFVAAMAPIRIVLEGQAGRVELPPGGGIIGADPACAVPVRDPRVSHMHAHVLRAADVVLVRDLGSSGGTWVNGNPVTVPQRLKSGDRLRVGSTEFVVRLDGAGAREAAPTPGQRPSHFPSALGVGDAAPHFEVRTGHSLGLSFALDASRQQASIGSDPICEIRLDDPSITRRHAILQLQGTAWHVTDANSYAGTFHNGNQLASGQWAPLREGDVVRVGEVELVFTSRPVKAHGYGGGRDASAHANVSQPGPQPVDVTRRSGPPAAMPAPAPTPAPPDGPILVRARLSFHGTQYPPVELGPRTVIGSHPGASNFLVQDPRVAPQHAEIVRAPDGFYVRDLGSPRGTVISGRALPPTAAPFRLRHGDVILVGGLPLLFEGAVA